MNYNGKSFYLQVYLTSFFEANILQVIIKRIATKYENDFFNCYGVFYLNIFILKFKIRNIVLIYL